MAPLVMLAANPTTTTPLAIDNVIVTAKLSADGICCTTINTTTLMTLTTLHGNHSTSVTGG